MPLPTDENAQALSNGLLQALDNLNGGVHPGKRPAHAKGIMLTGTFSPAPTAATLTSAPHASRQSTPVTVRFSNSSGIPVIPDNNPNASPRGMAIRFHLAEHVHTDIISVSHDGFPVRTPEEFLEFLQAVYASGPDAAKPTPVEKFVASHPAALRFVTSPMHVPASFAREAFFSVNAFAFQPSSGAPRFGRYRMRPLAGIEHLDAAAIAAQAPNFLFDEMKQRIANQPVKFSIAVQLAEPGDVVDDATVQWPEGRQEVAFGEFVLTALIPDADAEAARIIFDPIPRVDGISPSADPLLEARANLYLLSGRRRRSAISG